MEKIDNILNSKSFEKWLKSFILITLLILVNVLTSRYFVRIDLTEDQRFSITPATKSMLADLEDIVYIEVYLDGDLPAGFKRIKSAIQETLDEFQVYSSNKVQYQFVNPDAAASQQSRIDFLQSISRKGIQPTDVFLTENGNRVQKRIIPGALVVYGSRELGVQLFKGSSTASPEERLNQSIEGIEYELGKAIHTLTDVGERTIGLVRGHNELDSLDFYSFRSTLESQFRVKEISLNQPNNTNVDVLILAQPKSRFSAIEKYNLDQFIIGGHGFQLLPSKSARCISLR